MDTTATICNIFYVIDTSKIKEKSHDVSKESMKTWIPQANALQRKG